MLSAPSSGWLFCSDGLVCCHVGRLKRKQGCETDCQNEACVETKEQELKTVAVMIVDLFQASMQCRDLGLSEGYSTLSD